MTEYIEREGLVDEIRSLSVSLAGNNVFDKVAKESVLQVFDEQPTADVVKVVRCKDCANGCHKTDKTVVCKILNKLMITEDYCSYGAPEERGGEMSHITIEQLEELREAENISRTDFNGLLEDYTGFKAIPYTAFYYEDSAGNWVGDSDSHEVNEILRNAYIEVRME